MGIPGEPRESGPEKKGLLERAFTLSAALFIATLSAVICFFAYRIQPKTSRNKEALPPVGDEVA